MLFFGTNCTSEYWDNSSIILDNDQSVVTIGDGCEEAELLEKETEVDVIAEDTEELGKQRNSK